MSDIKNQNNKQGDKDEVVDVKRRSFTKAGIAAPVVMTLASRPVFGAQCLSNMLSGNLSNHGHRSECAGGVSPLFLATPNFDDENWSNIWRLSGFTYGGIAGSKKRVLDTQENKKKDLRRAKENAVETLEEWEKYSGGTQYNTVGFRDSDMEDRSLREVLNRPEGLGSDAPIYIAGLINAKYYDALNNTGTSADNYMFSEDEFWQLYNGMLTIPESANMSLRDLIVSGYS